MKIKSVKNWKANVLNKNKTIGDAIKVLNKTGIQIVCVVEKKMSFLGTITDGDIRRILNNKYFVEQKLEFICNRNPVIISPNDYDEKIEELLLKNNFRYVPVVKENRLLNIKQIYSKNIIYKKNFFVIPAGGFGKRLYPLTKKIPKPMIKIKNKPILEHVIVNAKRSGFRKFFILTHYLSNKIKNYFKNGERWNIDISYIYEESPLGTVGGLKLLKKTKLPIVVSNSDLISNIDLDSMLKFHKTNKSYLTIATRVFETRNRFGLMSISKNKRVNSIKEKPIDLNFINSGLYIFSYEAVKDLSNLKLKKIDITDFCNKKLLKKKRVLSYKFYDTWKDIGVLSDLKNC